MNTRFPNLPELEYTAMSLAGAVGIRVADCKLVGLSQVDDIPEAFLSHGEHVLVVERFDRDAGARIHFEDFAQIMGAVGDRKYTLGNEETNLKLMSRFVLDGAESVLEAVRRTTANLLLGNGDAHLKNWAFRYEDETYPTLSPAYDIVPTFVFGDTTMALKLGNTRRPESVTFKKMARAASYVGMDARVFQDEMKTTIRRAADTWPLLLKTLDTRRLLKTHLRDRWASLSITESETNPFA